MDFNQLQESLIKAKAVMSKSDGLKADPTLRASMESSNLQTPNLPPVSNNFNQESINSVVSQQKSIETPRAVTAEAVKNSKLPDDIKKLMIDHPIPTVKLGANVPDALIEGVAEKMKSMGMPSTPKTKNTPTQHTPQQTTKKITSKGLNNMIKKVISESLDELIEQKIKSVISESRKSDESIQIIVGNTILEGKITSTRDLS